MNPIDAVILSSLKKTITVDSRWYQSYAASSPHGSPAAIKSAPVIDYQYAHLYSGLFIPNAIGSDSRAYGKLAPAGEFLYGEVPKWGIRTLAVEQSKPERCIIRVTMEVQ